MNSPLLLESATRLAERIRTGETSAVAVVDAHIQAIESVNPSLNAVVAERFAEARAEAAAADARVASGETDLPPLLGVPCTIKESFELTGMPQAAGLVARRAVRSTGDATVVARWRAAGAIPLGVTNTSELNMWMESNNRVYGRSNNPYNRARIVGGSSGGEGAIVGSGASPFGLGADVGGSIRLPAFFNGVFGHKPTPGLVPNSGQYPIAEGEALRLLGTGPICRRAEDLYPLVRLAAGPDGIDASTRVLPLLPPSLEQIEELQVVVIEGNGLRRVSPELRAGMQRAARALEARGATVVAAAPRSLRRTLVLWSGLMSANAEHSFADLLGNGAPLSAIKQLLLWCIGQSPHTLPAIMLALVEGLPGVAPADVTKLYDETARMRDEFATLMGDRGVMLFPPFTRTAPRHGMPLLTPIDFSYTAIWNALELPVTQVPLGLDRQGLPLGVQVVGQPCTDHLTMSVALALEADLGGWVPPWTARAGS